MSELQEPTPFTRASEAVKNGQLDEAETLLAAILVETPKDAQAHALSFTIAMQQKDIALARQRAEAALALLPDDPTVRSNLGAVLVRENEFDAAMHHLNAAVEAESNHYLGRRHRGTLNAARGRYAEAIRDFKIAITARPTDAYCRMALADSLTEARRFEEAAAVIREAVNRHVGSKTQRTYHWGRLLFRMNRFPEARQAFASVLSADASQMKHYRALAAASFQCGDTIHAKRVTAAAFQKFPCAERSDGPPDLRVLVLEPLGGDSFTDIGRQPVKYTSGNFTAILPAGRVAYTHAIVDTGHDPAEALDLSQFDVAFNNRPVFEQIELRGHADRFEQFVAGLPMPIVNAPTAVRAATREANAKRFANADRFVFPETIAVEHETDIDATQGLILARIQFPIILRPRHTHFGHGVLLAEDEDTLRDFLRKNPHSRFYAIQYHDCASEDGLFRRYRLACMGGRIVPDGLRADFAWNVHNWEHGPEKWAALGLDKEEVAFWENPTELLGAPPEEFFREIIDATTLDIYGFDFGFLQDGRVIVYEVNSAMAIANGGDLKVFPYRQAQCDRIRQLIADFLFEKAGKTGASAHAETAN